MFSFCFSTHSSSTHISKICALSFLVWRFLLRFSDILIISHVWWLWSIVVVVVGAAVYFWVIISESQTTRTNQRTNEQKDKLCIHRALKCVLLVVVAVIGVPRDMCWTKIQKRRRRRNIITNKKYERKETVWNNLWNYHQGEENNNKKNVLNLKIVFKESDEIFGLVFVFFVFLHFLCKIENKEVIFRRRFPPSNGGIKICYFLRWITFLFFWYIFKITILSTSCFLVISDCFFFYCLWLLPFVLPCQSHIAHTYTQMDIQFSVWTNTLTNKCRHFSVSVSQNNNNKNWIYFFLSRVCWTFFLFFILWVFTFK